MTRLAMVKAERDHEHNRADAMERMLCDVLDDGYRYVRVGSYTIHYSRLDGATGGNVVVTYREPDGKHSSVCDWGTLDEVHQSHASAILSLDDPDRKILQALDVILHERRDAMAVARD